MFLLKSTFTLGICGPTKSGKTELCIKLLNNAERLIENKFEKITWILGNEHAIPKGLNLPVDFILGLPDEFENKSGKPYLYVIDDSMLESENNKSIVNLFTRGSHHQNISVIFITQNLFHQGKYARDIRLNFTHLCIMNNPSDRSQFSFLARQLYPENAKELIRIYKEITELPYSYLFIDLTQATHNTFRFRTDIFCPDYVTIFTTVPTIINNELVEDEVFGAGRSFLTRIEKHQV